MDGMDGMDPKPDQTRPDQASSVSIPSIKSETASRWSSMDQANQGSRRFRNSRAWSREAGSLSACPAEARAATTWPFARCSQASRMSNAGRWSAGANANAFSSSAAAAA